MTGPQNMSGLMDQIHELKRQLADAETRGATTPKPMPRSTDPAPDGSTWDEYEHTADWVDKLPPERHLPYWDGNGRPCTFVCAPCSMREEGVIYAWPCEVALKHGEDIALAYGWEAAT